jgi:Putative glucoamylase
VIYRAQDGKDFQPVGIQLPGTERYSDFIGKSGVTAQYKVSAMDRHYRQSPLSNPAIAATRELSDDELLTMLPQEVCFHYYWEGADPHSGMTRENIPGDERIVATGASSFGILALVVGSSRGFITREQAEERLTKIVSFLERAQRYHGAWSHYMDGATGKNHALFRYVRQRWGPCRDILGWAGQSKAAATYRAGWSGTSTGDRYENGHVYEGIKLDVGVGSGGPLFFAHYSYMGFNPHERDRYTDYFENNRNIALINLAYCIRNPGHFKGYGAGTWGLTARTYWSWGARVLISARMICARDSVRVDDFAGGGKPALADENGPEGASRQCACQNQWHWCRSPRGCGNREFSGE